MLLPCMHFQNKCYDAFQNFISGYDIEDLVLEIRKFIDPGCIHLYDMDPEYEKRLLRQLNGYSPVKLSPGVSKTL